MSRNKNNKSILDKVTELESVFGQKKAAEKLGVSVSTLRNYKTGKTSPKKDKEKKLNRIYEQNKKKITEEKVERYKKNVETKKTNRRKQMVRNPRLQSVQAWVNKEFDEDYIKVNIVKDAPPFIAPLDGRGQFTDGASPFGIPKGIKYVRMYGLYTTDYNKDGDDSKKDYIQSRLAITLRKEMNLEQALDYVEGKFYATVQQQGKRRLNPVRFIGYELP